MKEKEEMAPKVCVGALSENEILDIHWYIEHLGIR